MIILYLMWEPREIRLVNKITIDLKKYAAKSNVKTPPLFYQNAPTFLPKRPHFSQKRHHFLPKRPTFFQNKS